ncbi:MAG TPA: outer membrane protein transport protein [Candidatus Krumholzibacteria bacterium]|nr:outer membrane protein transport protein [Candidatus Krumholzibacteria bacterium]HPD72693.1 outer membrane protein transport protein [Candidatus Krumholzibacteria bacterium]HRY40375.1 outer membrane protein transport protein [Candidatus Krumholzibacteria bacterium]
MDRSSTRILLATGALLAAAGLARAGGFSIYEAGARATGMGCAVTASVDDGSAMFYNIAGLGFMPGTLVDFNLIPVMPSTRFQQVNPPTPGQFNETVDQSFLIPGLGLAHNPGGRFAFGLGVTAPFGLGVEWEDPETWVGRFTSYDVDLATIYVTPAVSYQATAELAIAVGADVAYQTIELNRYYSQRYGGGSELVNVVDVTLEGQSEIDVTPCFGVMYRPTPDLSLGAMYHHEKTMTYEDQDATLVNVAPDELRDAVDQFLDQSAGTPGLRDFAVDTELGLPHLLSLGAAYRFHPRLLVEVDLVHFGWANFNSLELAFDPDPTGGLSTVIPEKYEDRWQYRVGVDFAATPRLDLFAGYAYDESPQPKASMSPLLPDATRNDVSLGARYATGPWRFTASYMVVLNDSRDNLENGQPALFPEERDDLETVELKTMQAGSYETVVNILAFGVGYHF